MVARLSCEGHFLHRRWRWRSSNSSSGSVRSYFSTCRSRSRTNCVCLSDEDRTKLWIELVKATGVHDNLSKPLAPLINSLTISAKIVVLEIESGDESADCSSGVDGAMEWNDNGVDVCRCSSASNGEIFVADECVLSVCSFVDREFFSRRGEEEVDLPEYRNSPM